MDRVYDICCGIDVHKKLIVACFRHGRKQEVREFGATLGAEYYNQFNKERKINAYLKKLKALNWEAPVAMAGQPI